MLVAKGRLQLASGVQDYVRMLFAQKGLIIAALTPAIAGSAAALQGPMHGDPADRILIASAVATGARLMTHDQRIHEFAKSTKHLRCIDCSTN